MADYQGMKLRSPGKANGIVLESWGAKAVVMSSSDVYMALQRDTVDGANSGITTFRSRKWYEVANHVQMLWEQVTKMDMVINLKWWNSLSPDLRKIIEESSRSSAIWSWEQGIKEIEDDVKFLKEKGLEVIDFRESKPEEWEKMRLIALAALEKDVKPLVGDATWNEHVKMLNATKNGTKTWRKVLETMEW